MIKKTQKKIIKTGIQIFILILALIFLYFRPFFITKVVGTSMEPTLHANSIVLANSLDRNFQVGDVVVVEQNSEFIIKRIAYTTGQKLVCADLGERKFSPMPALPDIDREIKTLAKYGIHAFVLEIPKEYVYVLGDNEGESEDSRTFGPVPTKNIKAKIIGR
jgi:signal peptidase I